MTATLLLLVGVGCTCGALLLALGRPRTAAVLQRSASAAASVIMKAPPVDTPDILDSTQIYSKLYGLALGVEQISAEVPAGHEGIAAGVCAAVDSSAKQSRYALRRPMLLPQLLHAMKDTETSRRQLAAIITQDPALVGSLLKLANSALYRTSNKPVESVDRAVAILGTEGIRSLVAAALVQPVFRHTRGAFAAFPEIAWEHTFRSAAAAEAHAAFVEKTDRFAAQLLGLLMGLGAIVVFRMALDRYAAHPRLRPEPAVVAAAVAAHSAGAARRIAGDWELSPRIIEALEGEAPTSSGIAATPLGRSLHFGRHLGALSVLVRSGVIDNGTALASLPEKPAVGSHVERIWTHLGAQSK